MLTNELVRLYPRLFHLAEGRSWSSIAANGLMTSSQLCERFDVAPDRRQELLSARRPNKVELTHPTHGRVVLRDQKPLSVAKLRSCLTDNLTPEEWLWRLNDRVFFWLQEARMLRMLAAYPGQDHDLLEIDTAALVNGHEDRIFLSRINSGSTAYVAQPRGLATFRPLADYEHPTRRKALSAASDVAELAVMHGVGDIASICVSVTRIGINGSRRTIFSR